MKTRKHSGQLVAQLRKIIHKSQSQFAAMVGVSKHTVISVENGRNQLSRNLTKRIKVATGIDLETDQQQQKLRDEKSIADSFQQWRTEFYPSTEASALRHFDVMKNWLRIIFLAAARPGRAGNRDRLPAVRQSLQEWMTETREKFKLADEIDSILPDQTREINREAQTIASLLEDPKEAQKSLAEHGIDFHAIKKQLQPYAPNGCLIIEDEYSYVWSLSSPRCFIVATRKLIPKARCWIRTFTPGVIAPPGELKRLVRPHEPQEPLLSI